MRGEFNALLLQPLTTTVEAMFCWDGITFVLPIQFSTRGLRLRGGAWGYQSYCIVISLSKRSVSSQSFLFSQSYIAPSAAATTGRSCCSWWCNSCCNLRVLGTGQYLTFPVVVRRAVCHRQVSEQFSRAFRIVHICTLYMHVVCLLCFHHIIGCAAGWSNLFS